MNKFIVFLLVLPLIKSQQIENLDGEYNLNEMEDYLVTNILEKK